jgi:5-methylthioadenosine/S-adenosylhomocysteine deaminase
MRTADLIVHARWIIPIEAEQPYYENYSIVVNESKIVALLPTKDVASQWQSQHIFNLSEHALMPGMINAHGHSAMSLFRGLADDLPLMEWLTKHIWPAEQKWVSEGFVADGSLLAIVEMIKTGTTCFSDMYFFPEITAQVATKHQIRAQINFPVLDFPSAWAENANEYIRKGLKLHSQYQQSDLITTGFGPHAPYTVSDDPLKKILMLSEQMAAPIQIHLHETAFEIEEAIRQTGERPIKRLNRLGLLSPSLQAVHMTQLNDEDIELLNRTGAQVIHCPESNLKLASGFCPVNKLQQAGVNVALGTDGAASNNDLDMFGEMKTAALLAKGVSQNASALNAQQALTMATLNGARALGIEDVTGSLVEGKWADMIAIKMDHLEQLPVFNPISHIVYSGSSQHVTHSWIAGKIHMNNRVLTLIDQALLSDKIKHWANKITSQDSA